MALLLYGGLLGGMAGGAGGVGGPGEGAWTLATPAEGFLVVGLMTVFMRHARGGREA